MIRAIAACLAMALLSTQPALAAEAPVASSYETTQQSSVEEQPFKVIILGTRSGADIDLIRKNVEKLAYVSIFIPAVVSQRHIEFDGRFAGEASVLLADLESLAQDRYEVKSRSDRRSGLVITLRKIQPVSEQ